MIRKLSSSHLGMTENTALDRSKNNLHLQLEYHTMIRKLSSSNLGMAENTALDRSKNNLQQLVDILEEDEQQLADILEEYEQQLADILEEVEILRHNNFGRIESTVFLPLPRNICVRYIGLMEPMRDSDIECCMLSDDTFQHSEPVFTPTEIRNLVLERIAFLENDQRLTAKEKRSPMNQRKNETNTSSQNDHSKRPTTKITGNVNALQDEIRRKGLIGVEDNQLELDNIRKLIAELTDTVKTLREEIRQEQHIMDDGDIAEEFGYIRWPMAELMDALKELRREMRRQENKQNEEVFPHVWDNKNAANGAHASSLQIKYGKSLTDNGIREKPFSQKPIGTKRKLNIVVIRKEVSDDDANQHSKRTKHIAAYDMDGERSPTYGNLSALLCELCINKNKAVNWCETCNSNICVSCTCFHKDVRMMMNHRIFNLP